MADTNRPSYHDVTVHVDGQVHKISDNYAYELTCTRLAGWRLWRSWDGDATLIGGEYDSGDFRIEVQGVAVCIGVASNHREEVPNEDRQ